MTPKKSYEVTGELTPDATGTYNDAGEHNGKRYYELAGNGWFLWWDGDANWLLSTEIGVTEDNWWTRTDPNIEGLYIPRGTATGTATVTEI